MKLFSVPIRVVLVVIALVFFGAPPVSAATIPGSVRKLQAEVKTDRIEVSWEKPADDGDRRIREYEVYVAGPGFRTNKTDVEVQLPSPGTYTARVRARNSQGWGPWSETAQFTIRTVGEPSAPTEVNLTVRKSDDLRLTYSAPNDDGGSSVREYRVRLSGPGYDNRVWTVGRDRTVDIKDVADGLYSADVAARNRSGWGPWAKAAQARVGNPPPTSPQPRIGPFASKESFVGRQYTDLFDRSADASGLTFWMSQIADDGSSASQVIDAMMASPEFVPNNQAIRLYLAYFNRLPDNAGLNYWVDVLKRQGAPLSAVSGAFASSAEFRQMYGPLTDADYVALVYNNVLLRVPDAGGYNYWIAQMRLGLGRGSLMTLFSDSAEFQTASNPAVQTVAIYNSMLDRSPRVEEFQRWVAAIGADPARRAELVDQIFHSDEYRTRVS